MYLWFDYVKKTESEVVDYRYPPHRIKGKIKIGIIGDSWASGQKIDAFLRDALMAKGIESVIISSGQRGAKSRRIYKNLFEPADSSFSSNHMLFGKPLDLSSVFPYYPCPGTNRATRACIRSARGFSVIIAFWTALMV